MARATRGLACGAIWRSARNRGNCQANRTYRLEKSKLAAGSLAMRMIGKRPELRASLSRGAARFARLARSREEDLSLCAWAAFLWLSQALPVYGANLRPLTGCLVCGSRDCSPRDRHNKVASRFRSALKLKGGEQREAKRETRKAKNERQKTKSGQPKKITKSPILSLANSWLFSQLFRRTNSLARPSRCCCAIC